MAEVGTNLDKNGKAETSEVWTRSGEKSGVAEKGDIPVVVVRNGFKRYGIRLTVLQNFSMTVKKGAIYSLLGSSGCGKTTALSCIVGSRKLDQGNLLVFGFEPGVKAKCVGYMPQEISLYNDFSIAETLHYFGTLCGMNHAQVKKKMDFLKSFLYLPATTQRVGTLSGGQRRRTAFAVALVHDKCFSAGGHFELHCAFGDGLICEWKQKLFCTHTDFDNF